MNLVSNTAYKVREGHPFHASRIGRFQFLGGPKSDVIVLSDMENDNVLFAVGLNDLTDFNPEFGDRALVSVQERYLTPAPPAIKRTVQMKIYGGGGLDCLDEKCAFKRECAIHTTAGDFRSESGFTPEITVGCESPLSAPEFACATVMRELLPECAADYPINYDDLGQGSLLFKNGTIVSSAVYLPGMNMWAGSKQQREMHSNNLHSKKHPTVPKKQVGIFKWFLYFMASMFFHMKEAEPKSVTFSVGFDSYPPAQQEARVMRWRKATFKDISCRAYYRWERDGCPSGKDLDYWLAAEKEFRHGVPPGNGIGFERLLRHADDCAPGDGPASLRDLDEVIF